LKARVLNNKQILVSDPRLKDMNPVRWAFEIEAQDIAETHRVEEYKAIFDIVRDSLISVLGVNLMPVENEDGSYRQPKDYEFIPLAFWMGREEIIKEVVARQKAYFDQENAVASLKDSKYELTPEELDDMLDGDISFEDGSGTYWNSVETKALRDQLIEIVPDKSIKKSRVVVETDEEVAMPTTKKIKIESD
jgi:hypothetical protein